MCRVDHTGLHAASEDVPIQNLTSFANLTCLRFLLASSAYFCIIYHRISYNTFRLFSEDGTASHGLGDRSHCSSDHGTSEALIFFKQEYSAKEEAEDIEAI